MEIILRDVKQIKISDDQDGWREITIETENGDTYISLQSINFDLKKPIPIRRVRD